MKQEKRYFRVITTVYPLKKAQMVGHWIYARIPYAGYELQTIDELDDNLFQTLSQHTKQILWQIKDIDLGWETIKMRFLNLNPYVKKINILPTIPDLNLGYTYEPFVEPIKEFRSEIDYLTNRIDPDPDIEIIPKELYINITIDKFKDLIKTYQPYFNAK